MKRLPSITRSATRVQPTRDMKVDVRASDFAALATLWNECNPGWPGGFSHGRETAASMRRELRDAPFKAIYITEAGRRIVAFCSLWQRAGQNRTAYVALLNSHPAFHGQGHGKSVMLAAIDRLTRDGVDVLELHTWSGNEKAMGVYQRTGFMWAPGGDGAFMQNFVPYIRRSPVGRLFFATRDWYATFQREATFRPDEMRRDTRLSYEYVFRDAEGMLRFVFDGRSQLPVEIETDRFLVSLRHREHEPIAGTDQRIRLRLVNKTGKPLKTSFAAGGDAAVKIRYRKTVAVGKSFTDRIDFSIRPAGPRKFGDPNDLLAWIDATIDDLPLRLAIGCKFVSPLNVSLDDAPEHVAPGERVTLKVKIESRLKVPCKLEGRISAVGGRMAKAVSINRRLKAKGKVTIPLTVTVGDALTLSVKPSIRVVLADRVLRPRIEPLRRAIVSEASCGGWIGPTEVGLVGPTARLTVRRYGERSAGGVAGFSTLTGESVIGLSAPRLGPPYDWSGFFDVPASVELRRGDGCVTAVLSGRGHRNHDLELRREVTLFPSGLIRVCDFVHNRGRRSFRLAACLYVGQGAGSAARWAVPTSDGVLLEEPGKLPQSFMWPNRPIEKVHWPEPWLAAMGKKGAVGGAIWPADIETTPLPGYGGTQVCLTNPTRVLRAGVSMQVAEMHLVATTGDWEVVRAWWKRLDKAVKSEKPGEKPSRKIRHRGLVEVRIEPGEASPIWLPGGRGTAKVIASVVGHHVLDVGVTAPSAGAVRFRPSRLDFKEIVGPASRTAEVRLTAVGEVSGPQTVELEVCLGRYVQRKPLTVIVPRRGTPTVGVREVRAGLWAVDNGLVTARIDLGFGGSMVGLVRRRGGRRQWLDSPWPKVGVHPWHNPWFGGVSPMLSGYSTRWHQGNFDASRVVLEREGVQFRGIEIRWQARTVDKEKRRLTIRYLLARGVPAVRCEIEAHGSGKADVRLRVFARDMREADVRTYTDRVTDGFLTGSIHDAEANGLRWVLSEQPATGRTLCVAVGGERGKISAYLPGWPASTARFAADIECGGKAANRAVCWIVPCLDLAEARQWTAVAGS